jgi:hypothetical protein
MQRRNTVPISHPAAPAAKAWSGDKKAAAQFAPAMGLPKQQGSVTVGVLWLSAVPRKAHQLMSTMPKTRGSSIAAAPLVVVSSARRAATMARAEPKGGQTADTPAKIPAAIHAVLPDSGLTDMNGSLRADQTKLALSRG